MAGKSSSLMGHGSTPFEMGGLAKSLYLTCLAIWVAKGLPFTDWPRCPSSINPCSNASVSLSDLLAPTFCSAAMRARISHVQRVVTARINEKKPLDGRLGVFDTLPA